MRRVPVPFLALTLAAAIVGASHAPTGICEGPGGLGIVEVTAGTGKASFYVDDRNVLSGRSVWVYMESNGIWTSQGPGLHQGDVTDHNLQRGNPCGPATDPGFLRCSVGESPETCYDHIRSFIVDALVL